MSGGSLATSRLLYGTLFVAVVAFVGLLDLSSQERVIAALVGLGFLLVASRRPGPAILVLIVGLPAQMPLLSLAYQYGVPAGVLRGLGWFKEAIVVGLVIAALRAISARSQRPDLIDKLSLAFASLVAAYFVLQFVAEPVIGTMFPQAPRGLYAAGLAIRLDLGFLALLASVRTLRLDDPERERALSAIAVAGVIVALGAIVESVANDTWTWFANDLLGIDEYKAEIFSDPRGNASTTTVVGGREFLRAGSIFDQLSLGPYLFASMGILMSSAAAKPSRRTLVALGLVAGGIVVTITRSAVLGALVGALVTAWHYRGRLRRSRRRLTWTVTAMTVVIVSTAVATGLADRTLAAFRGEDASTDAHEASLERGWDLTLEHPEGHGLGYQPHVLLRGNGSSNVVVTESSYLQVSVELGVVGGLLFVAIVIAIARRLARDRDDPLAVGVLGAMGAMMVNGFFLHTWFYLQASWTLMIAVGLAIPRESPGGAGPEEVGSARVAAAPRASAAV